MQYPHDFIDDLLIRTPISHLIGQHVNWDRKKTNAVKGDYWSCCPFHNEKNPSFHCDDRKGVYYCFSCHATGNHLTFLSTLLGCSFIESVQKLAVIAGVSLPTFDPILDKKQKKQTSLIQLIDIAADFFHQSLKNNDNKRLRYYLDKRGINSHSIETFKLGYAPDSRHSLEEYLLTKGFTQENIIEAGLLIHGDNITTPYDRFRDRLIFPILSSRGQGIAFGGRSLSKGENIKYLNSPETILFHKGKNLYNFFGALNYRQKSIRQDVQKKSSSFIVLVEGYMDVVSLHQAGIQNVVSSLGTSLTEDQLRLLWKLSPRVVLCFDGDDPGLRAAYKSVDLVLSHLSIGNSVNFILLSEGEDPDSFVQRYGKIDFEKLILESVPLVDVLWKRETEYHSFETPDACAELEGRLKNCLDRITDQKLRYYYFKSIQERLHHLFQTNPRPHSSYGHGQYWGKKVKYRDKEGPSQRLMQSSLVKGKHSKKPSLREAALLLTLINHPKILQEQCYELTDISYDNSELQKMWSFLFSEFVVQKDFSREEINQKLCTRGFGELLQRLDKQVRDAGLWSATAEANIVDVRKGYQQAVALYKRFRLLSRQKADLERQIAQMTEQGEEKKTTILISILNDIHIQINTIECQEAIIEGFGKMSGRV
ncbi:DNA primase [Candidatus Liberibacter solanacearum]|uniref:DNA primase n=2 Tax=Candidatus Liberibacter solanacearum TaxID=556287 RepID=A0A1V2N934_9HYPH|nr:DNA primase [Candidatus Liberibacter solanacearum]ONI60246.1 DNA primase [Candidatus Liberibacter solanacearum]